MQTQKQKSIWWKAFIKSNIRQKTEIVNSIDPDDKAYVV